MYSMVDAEFFISCFFFIICIMLNFWLINLFIVVITNMLSAIREETQKSTFSTSLLQPIVDEQDEA
ncbi:hypothetical protein EDB87DRAFT_1628217 [Lactarius vividus]|nr:hypothetical protein EDB87DRAFT_1628217 [Lactarius vividus]